MHPRQSRIKHDQNTPARTKPRTGNNHKRRKMPQTNTPATERTHDIGQPEKPEMGKTEQKQPKYYQTTQAALKMMDNGVDARTALQLVNNTPKPARQTISSLKAKYRQYSLTNPKLVKLAHNAVKDCLTDQPIISKRTDKQGNEIIEENAPTWANKIAAASMVYDRVEPTRQPEAPGGGLTVNIIPIAAQEIIDRMTAWKTRQVEGNVIDVQSGGQIEAGNG
jgi:hypothetical protein